VKFIASGLNADRASDEGVFTVVKQS
jgi:hypothetical protein